MEDVQRRMMLSDSQRDAVIHLDDNGVADPAPLFVMDFDTWTKIRPINFFNYFSQEGTVASFSRYKPVWQRYELLYPIESRVLMGVFKTLDSNPYVIFSSEQLSRRFYRAYVVMSGLVDEMDYLVDQGLRYRGSWNHGYVFNDILSVGY